MGSNESTAMSYFVQKSMQKCRLWERLFGGDEWGGGGRGLKMNKLKM